MTTSKQPSGAQLAAIRTAAGKGLADIARGAGGVSTSAVFRWEKQNAIPDERREAQVAAAYGLSRNELRNILGRVPISDPVGDATRARLSELTELGRKLSPDRQDALLAIARILQDLA